jgi:hypothetical protein
MSVNTNKLGKFLLTAGLLVVLAQGLWQLPALQDYLAPDNHWESDLISLHNESWKIENKLTSLRLRVDYLKWLLSHRGTPQPVSMDWMAHFPFSECIRPLAPKFFWNLNIYLAYKNQVQLQRKLKYVDTIVKYIQLHNKQKFSVYLNEILANKDEYQRLFKVYNSELIKLDNQLNDLRNNPYK